MNQDELSCDHDHSYKLKIGTIFIKGDLRIDI